MIRLIKFLFTGDWHLHKWEAVDKVQVTYVDRLTGSKCGYWRYTMKCAYCGNMEHYDSRS